MSYILCIESSSTVCSVALSKEGRLVQLKELDGGYSHSENLTSFIESILKDEGIEAKALQAVAVSKGPGSYTGLRIGVSSAKGICYALDIPLISVSTLQALAYSDALADVTKGLLCPLVDARRMEVYTSMFDKERHKVSEIEAKIVDKTSFQEELKEQTITFFGNGMEKCRELLSTNVNARFVEGVNPSAKQMVTIATMKFTTKQFEDVAYFEPFYLKDFVALKPKQVL